MKMSPDGAWYFSRDGQQSGPLAFAEIKEKADEGVLKPRTDLIWKEGMADWTPVGEIDGMFERREIPAPELGVPAAATAVTAALAESEATGSHMGNYGGARRRSYLFILFILPSLAVFLFGYARTALPALITPEIAGYVQQYGPLILVVFSIYIGIQRFANLGMSRWWYLANFVPILNIWTSYRCFACPEGYAVHKKMDGVGILLAILYWLFLVAVIAIVALMVAVMAGAAGSPEIQKQIKDFLETFRTQVESGSK